MKKIVQAVCGALSAGVLLLLTALVYIQTALPDNFQLAPGERFFINSRIHLSAAAHHPGIIKTAAPKVYDKSGNSYDVWVSLFDPPAQTAQSANRKMVVPGGTPFGIKMYCDGVMVVGLTDIQIGTENLNPAKEAGLKVGDVLTYIDGNKVEGNTDVARYVSRSEGAELTLTVLRDGQELALSLYPVRSELEKTYKAGIWVRDSSAGIGTMTYFDPDTMSFAGLGHAICDIDTGELMPLSRGEIVDVNISGVHPGQSGKPGELKGTFSSAGAMGRLLRNTEYGVFGELDSPYLGADPIPIASKQEVHAGPAVILSTISGNKPQAFDIMVEKVSYSDINPTKNMVIKVLDEQLLEATGGIVQGMSGSPILQDGKLAGAVTHVFVNDPSRGYGIFAENMEKMLQDIEDCQQIA